MTKKNLVVMAVFFAGLLGGGTAAVASARSQSADKAPCAIDMCRDINGRCVICPEF